MVKQPEATTDMGSYELPWVLGSLYQEWRPGAIWGTRYSYWENKQRPLDILQPFWERRLEDGPCSSQSSTSSSPWSLRCEWRHCLRSFKQRSMRQHLVHTGRKRLQRCLLFIPFDVATKSQAHCEASYNRGRTEMTGGLSEKSRPNREQWWMKTLWKEEEKVCSTENWKKNAWK